RTPAPKDEAELKAVAWFDANADDDTHEVGTLRPNALGVYDMLGNVAEWVVDPTTKQARVAGGGYTDAADDVNPLARQGYTPAWQRNDPAEPKSRWWMCNGFHVGVRLVMED